MKETIKRFMKKAAAVLLAAAMLGGVTPALASETAVSVGSVSAKAGETVTLDVRIEGNRGLTNFDLSVKSDEALTLTAIGKNGCICAAGMFAANVQAGLVSWISSGEVTQEAGTLFRLTFMVDASAGEGEHEVSVSTREGGAFSGESGSAAVSFVSGSVTVTASGGSGGAGGSGSGSSSGGGSTGGSGVQKPELKQVYTDVAPDAWYFQCVGELSVADIVSGYPDGSFRPSGMVTYAEALKLILLASGYAPDDAASMEDDGLVETEESAGAPPERFDIYVQAGDYDPILLKSYTGTEMRAMARLYNPDRTALKYSSVSYSGAAGRVTTEYITLSDLLAHMADGGEPISFGSGDYLIMGEDFTKDKSLIDAGYDRSQLTGNWYSYDGIIGAERYCFPNWDSGSEEDAEEVPAVIALKSYGGSSGVSDELLGYYKSSVDYLWAYVLYFGQSSWSEMTYSRFYYGQTQAIIRYDGDTELNATLALLIDGEIDRALSLKESTVVAVSANEVAQGRFWVTQDRLDRLDSALNAAKAAVGEKNARNGGVYSALLELTEQCDEFEAARQSGAREGYFWYTENTGDTYIITTAQQLIELGRIVRGEAVDTGTHINLDQDSFTVKTVLLACDIDLGGYIVNIGNAEYAFNGTFNGQGYTISGLDLYYNSRDYVGLFGNIGPDGIVKNFTADGAVSVNRGWSYAGGIAAGNSGVIENIRCDIDVTTAGSGVFGSYVGGISGYNGGTVRNCVYTGSITTDGGFNSGDITGRNAGTVAGCLAENGIAGDNLGTVSGCISTRGPLAAENGAVIKKQLYAWRQGRRKRFRRRKL